MPNDPDFHDCAASWLDASGDDGSHRVLREILRDSPDAAAELAALGRTEAALQLAGLTQHERLQHARRLIQPPFGAGMRRLVARPAFRWSAAAALCIAGLCWYIFSRGDDTAIAKRPLSSPLAIHRQAPPAPAKIARMPAVPAPADKAFVQRMKRFIVPEFRATRVPLATALDTLRKSVADIDASAAPDFTAFEELPDDLTVNLHLKFQPVDVLMDLIAIQTGTKFMPAGRGYTIGMEAGAPMPGGSSQIEYQLSAVRRFLERQGLPTEEVGPAQITADVIGAAFGEKPAVMETNPFTLQISGSDRLHRLLRRALSGESGTPPGTWAWNFRAVELRTPEAQAEFERLTASWRIRQSSVNSEEFQAMLRDISAIKGLDLMTAPGLTPAPGFSEKWFAGQESAEQNHPDNWTGIRWTVRNEPAGDSGGRFAVEVQVQGRQGNDPDHPLVFSKIATTAQIADGHTMLLSGLQSSTGGDVVVFLTGHRDPSKVELPSGIPVPGRQGFVRSPYSNSNQLVDVAGLPSGTKVMCPYSGKHFRVP